MTFILLSIASYAQVSAYSFNSSSGTYSPISGGTQLHAGAIDDATSVAASIGFTFVYDGVPYSTIKANSNGWASFGAASTGGVYTPLSSTGTHHPCLSPLGRDLQGGAAGDVSIETTGTAPYRIATVQYSNYRRYAGAQDFNFQIKLYETTNIVQFVYGTMVATGLDSDYDCGITGSSNADFNIRTTTTDWSATTAGATNAANMTLDLAIVPASGLTFTWSPAIPTPPAPFQVGPTASCATGAPLDVSGTAGTNITWYWQTSNNGTSTAIPYTGVYNVYNNGTFYLRAYNTVSLAWSYSSSSVTVTDIPSATAPLAPIAAANPACVTTGTTLSLNSPILGYEYYWQGTTVNGVSTANNATTPLPVSTTGTYTVAAFDPATQCWSPTTGTLVTVDTYIPGAPTVPTNNFNICSGVTTLEVSANGLPTSGNVTLSFGTNLNSPGPATSFPLTVPALPAGATITSAQLLVSSVNAINGSWRSEARVGLSGMFTLAATQMSALNSSGLITPDPVINLAGFPTTGGTLNLVLSETADDGGAGTVDATYGQVQLVINYSLPASTIAWYDAASAGTTVGTGATLETVGTSVLTNPASFGTYEFFAGSVSGACQSAARTLVTVNVVDVNAVLTPVNVSCNGNNDGSFALGTIECGASPFLYSVNGGVFGGIPTDLTAGTYSVVIEDDNGLQSAPITVVITQPAAPANLTLVDANYYTADISWTTTGNEISWTVVYGPAGFDPLTEGETITAFTNFTTLTDLLPDTDYEFYVTADCGANPETSGPAAFSTNAGFYTYDNACGPGYFDISGTGTGADLGDDLEVDFTLPWTLNYQGTSVTQMTIGNNGGIAFNTLTGNVDYVNTAMATAPTGLYPYWDDLLSNGGAVYTEVIGTAPNRSAIIQWNVSSYGPDTEYAFQVVIEEATDEIYFIYDNTIVGDVSYDNGISATIGVAGPQSDVEVSFNNTSYLEDNSCVHFYSALCPNPVMATTQIFQEEAILDWNTGLYGETEWTVIYGPTGFDPLTEGTTESGLLTSDINISMLEQLTTYDVYIYSECTIDDLTSPGLLYTFTTLPWCNTPTMLGGTTSVDSLLVTWDFLPVLGAPNGLTGFNLMSGGYDFDLYNGTLQVATGLEYGDTIVDVDYLAGGVYEVYVQAVCGTDTSNYAGPYTFVMPLSNDTVCGAEMLSVDGTVYYFNNTGATVTTGESAIMPTGSNPDGYNNTDLPLLTWGSPILEGTNWYSFVAPASGSLRFSGEDENFFASQIAIYETADCDDFSMFELVAASDQVNEAIDTKIAPNFTICGLTPGNTYYIMHDAWSNGTPIFGQYSIKMTPIVLNSGTLVDVMSTCTGDTVDLFDGITGYDNGGVWTAENAAAGTGVDGSEFASAGLAYQIFDFEYRVTDGCAFDTTYAHVNIFAPSSAGNDGVINVCRNEPFDLLSGLTGNADLGGAWYNPSQVIMASSATTASNIAGQFNYNYISGNGVCPNDTALVLVNVDGTCNYLDIEEMFFGSMTVMPNPSNGVFNITNSGSTEVFSFEVTDVEGRVILVKDAAINGTSTTEIDLTGKVTGLYLIRVYNDNAEKTFRVILQ